MRKAKAFSPGHITGLFQIRDESPDPLRKGSRGAGVAINRGVSTTVTAEASSRNSFNIRINGEPSNTALVSEYVLNVFLSRDHRRYRVTVDHTLEIPVGSGIGSSGAGALSLSLALNEALGLGLTKVEAAQIAHSAEIACKTGLGTVIAELQGGLEIRVVPGAPGVGRIIHIRDAEDYVVTFLSFGPLSTRVLLKDEAFRTRVNLACESLLEELLASPSPKKLMEKSKIFTEKVGVHSERVMEILRDMGEHGYIFGGSMLGETAFTLIRRGETEEVLKLIEKYASPRSELYIAEIDFEGARLI